MLGIALRFPFWVRKVTPCLFEVWWGDASALPYLVLFLAHAITVAMQGISEV